MLWAWRVDSTPNTNGMFASALSTGTGLPEFGFRYMRLFTSVHGSYECGRSNRPPTARFRTMARYRWAAVALADSISKRLHAGLSCLWDRTHRKYRTYLRRVLSRDWRARDLSAH